MLRKTIITLAALLALPVSAGEFSSWGKITQTYTSGSWTMVTITGDPVNPDGCQTPSNYALNTSDSNYEGMLSVILAAQMAQKEIRFWLAGCAGQSGDYPHIISVQLNR